MCRGLIRKIFSGFSDEPPPITTRPTRPGGLSVSHSRKLRELLKNNTGPGCENSQGPGATVYLWPGARQGRIASSHENRGVVLMCERIFLQVILSLAAVVYGVTAPMVSKEGVLGIIIAVSLLGFFSLAVIDLSKKE